MTNPRYSTQSIERAVYDSANSAKRVNVVEGEIDVNEVLPTSAIGVAQVSMTDASAAIGGAGTARLESILIVNHGSSDVFLNVGGAAELTDFKLEYGASVSIPIKAQVNGICASGETATVSYIEA